MSGKKIESPGDAGLNDREAQILRTIIREHITTGEPIGSAKISRGLRLDLSPASVRNTMAALEERGLLTQPHTSAGRVPTSRAYRLYVDSMIRLPRVAATQAQLIDQALLESRGEIAELLGQASRQLSRFSNHVGLVLSPELGRVIVEHVEFVRIDSRRLVAVVVSRSGVVNNRILEIEPPIPQDELDRIGRYLSAEFRGKTLPQIRESLARRVSEETEAYDQVIARGLDLGRRTVEGTGGGELFVEGTSNLLDSPEFADPEKIRSLMHALEEKKTLIDLLGRVLEGEGVQVVIGDEQPSADLASCSLVAASYGTGDRVMGTLGIVGPTRMEYARAIALVDYLAQVLNRYFSNGDN